MKNILLLLSALLVSCASAQTTPFTNISVANSVILPGSGTITTTTSTGNVNIAGGSGSGGNINLAPVGSGTVNVGSLLLPVATASYDLGSSS